MNINLAAIYHETKSKYAYAYNEETIHIRIRTAKNDVDKIRVMYGDPFNWGPNTNKEESKEQNEWVWRNEDNEVKYMTKEYSTSIHDYYFIALKPKYRRMKYIFVLEKDEVEILYGCRNALNLKEHPDKLKDLFNYYNFPFLNKIDIYQAPNWVKDTIWYQIFPERFNNGNTRNDPKGTLPWGSIEKVQNDMFFGGDIEGIIQKLDYIKELGATGIYFTPLFKSPSTHKYDTENYYEIDPQFGDLESMKQLVSEAHKRGIRVMLDAVFNHCGWNHPFWQDVVKNNENSKYVDYFHIKKFPVFEGDSEHFRFKEDENMLNFDTFAFTPKMPKWNTENEEVKNYLYEVGRYWIKECDIDAWRLDVSNEVDHEFWRGFKKVCDETKKDFFIVGENWDEANPWLKGDQMLSVMNYEFLFACWNFFGKGTDSLQFKENINQLLTMYPKNVTENLFNLLDSHDSTRILTICDHDIRKVRLAYVFFMTYSGTPSIYYGTEIGLDGAHDPDNRRCMIWEQSKQDLSMLEHVKKLISLRKQHPSFKSVDIDWIEASIGKFHLIYKKESDTETIICILNNQNTSQTIALPDEFKNKSVFDLYHEQSLILNTTITLMPYDFRIIKL